MEVVDTFTFFKFFTYLLKRYITHIFNKVLWAEHQCLTLLVLVRIQYITYYHIYILWLKLIFNVTYYSNHLFHEVFLYFCTLNACDR